MRFSLLLFLLLPACLACAQTPGDLNFRYKEISLPELMLKKRNGDDGFIILDVRTKGEYNDTLSGFRHLNIGRISGAINIPLQDLQQQSEALQQLEPYRDKEIYVICSHSYRSRTISKLLLEKNFPHVINVKGGMSEWFRNYDEMKAYAAEFHEHSISYNNISPSQLFSKLESSEPVLLIGFKNPARNFFDSLITGFYQRFPGLKNVEYFTARDSAAALARAKAAPGKTIVTFNIIGTGGGEMANLFAQNGIKNVYYLVGNLAGFYEYMSNFRPEAALQNHFLPKNTIRFYSALSLCRSLDHQKDTRLIDLSHDTLFAKPTAGTKLTYRHIKGAVNFPYYQSADAFAGKFPDKTREYVLIPHQGYTGMELADALLAKGYRIGWLIGGNERWEWYTNNIDVFTCKDHFIK